LRHVLPLARHGRDHAMQVSLRMQWEGFGRYADYQSTDVEKLLGDWERLKRLRVPDPDIARGAGNR
ncbi:MAG: hypothetical protein ABSG53_24075, partial [Thermoguttaceae bacterium]